MSDSPDSEFYDAKVIVLSEYIKHHVGEEEKSGDGVFARAKAAEVDMNALGQRLQSRKLELLSRAETRGFSPPQPRALSLRPSSYLQETQAMDRRYDRDRDEQGRFTSDDDDRRYSRSGGQSFSRSDDRDRGEYGRFTGDDDRRRYSGRSSRGYEDDDRSYRGRSEGSGWYVDSRGHSEAARRGWQNRW